MTTRPILFVCLGNICRSPLAEGIFKSLADGAGLGEQLPSDSVGLGRWHVGHPPDPRSIATAARHGLDIADFRARQLEPSDFDRFSLILAMDHDNLAGIRARAPARTGAEIHSFMAFATGRALDVPDPYYGPDQDFEAVYKMLFSACQSLLEKLSEPTRS
ncbi:low molecular weight protein-tyrosine-phosphatase [Rhizobium halophytocola]|uniref:protein-tyrosine-phosphatase n=1 Tax=Rhizobium halophytocola TaxID=735519 RepID=A0ABS4E2V4_9HYPH|nr:low molecular weight protein-tyrosine-phosphatase [Rhizobium halophytocola]MBP1852285.1 protein-tyrosine phosphatase [Rhizobium halophytocola]